jgi:hypothetical protein
VIEVPENPETERIESMCMRYDHAHGIPVMFETEDDWHRRQEYNRTTMRQLYEEATGQGFFRTEKPTHTARMAGM